MVTASIKKMPSHSPKSWILVQRLGRPIRTSSLYHRFKKLTFNVVKNIGEAVVEFKYKRLSLGLVKREVQLGIVRIEMKIKIV